MSSKTLHRMGETDLEMIKVAERSIESDSGRRVFFREDPSWRLNYELTRNYLQTKSRHGDLKCASDLEELEKCHDAMKNAKAAFFATHDIATKKNIARKYKVLEDEMIKLLSPPAEE